MLFGCMLIYELCKAIKLARIRNFVYTVTVLYNRLIFIGTVAKAVDVSRFAGGAGFGYGL